MDTIYDGKSYVHHDRSLYQMCLCMHVHTHIYIYNVHFKYVKVSGSTKILIIFNHVHIFPCCIIESLISHASSEVTHPKSSAKSQMACGQVT